MHLQSSAHNNTDKWKQSTSPSSLHKDNTVHTCNPQNRFERHEEQNLQFNLTLLVEVPEQKAN